MRPAPRPGILATMRRAALSGFLLALFTVAGAAPQADDPIAVAENDWPWWRGSTRDGTANENQKPPTSWSATENIAWKTEIPGRGHGSPTIFGEHVYLATCDEASGSQSVLCFDRVTGRRLWGTRGHHRGA